MSEQASTIVGQLGLGALYTSLQDFQPKHGPLSNLPGCDALAIQTAVVCLLCISINYPPPHMILHFKMEKKIAVIGGSIAINKFKR